jgi:hypothetical protein
MNLERLRLAGNELEQELLSSALGDAPEPAARDRLIAGLGIGTAVVATAAQSAALGTGLGAGVKTTVAGKLTVLGIAKWVSGGLVAGAITAGALGHASAPRRPLPPPDQARPAAALGAVVDRSKPARPVAAPAVEEPAPPPAQPPPSVAALPDQAPAPSVTDEIHSLDQARAELAGGQPRRALDALDAYEREFPAGTLRPEADLVRLQAHARLGDKSTVAARARAYLARYPASPHAPQVRSLLEQAEPARAAAPPAPARPVAPPTPARSSSVASFPVGG